MKIFVTHNLSEKKYYAHFHNRDSNELISIRCF